MNNVQTFQGPTEIRDSGPFSPGYARKEEATGRVGEPESRRAAMACRNARKSEKIREDPTKSNQIIFLDKDGLPEISIRMVMGTTGTRRVFERCKPVWKPALRRQGNPRGSPPSRDRRLSRQSRSVKAGPTKKRFFGVNGKDQQGVGFLPAKGAKLKGIGEKLRSIKPN